MSNQQNPAQKSIVFEQPLNERIRTFMRIEHLSARCNYCLDQTTPWGSHLSLSALIELINLISRGDLKQEILKELSRQLNTLDGFLKTEKIDRGKLQDLINTHEQLISEMSAINGQLLLSTKENEFIKAFSQRASIPGGTCDFDLPAYHFWLAQDINSRQQALREWVAPLELIQRSITTCLNLIRTSTTHEDCIAEQGFYQRTLDLGQPSQILRVAVDRELGCFPEISAGKHRFSIRFMNQHDLKLTPKQVQLDMKFELTCCTF
jgi:cell division protein ZapD